MTIFRIQRIIAVFAAVFVLSGGGTICADAQARQVQKWAARDEGPVNASDSSRMMAVDFAGNAFVTGQVSVGTNETVMATWKYDINGAVAWGGTPRYYAPTPIAKLNYGVAVFPDNNGGCFVAGAVTKDGEGLNIVFIHYTDDGDIEAPTPIFWNNHLQNGDDYPVEVTTDGAGNYWVGGVSTGSGSGADFMLIGFSAVDGSVLAYDRYDGPSHKTDVLVGIDAYGVSSATGTTLGITVVGTSFDDATKNDIVIVEYDYVGGVLSRRMNSPIRWTNGGGASNETAASFVTLPLADSGRRTIIGGHTDAWVGGVDQKNNMLIAAFDGNSLQWGGVYNGAGNGDDYGVKVDEAFNTGNPSRQLIYLAGTMWAGATDLHDVMTVAFEFDGTPYWGGAHIIDGINDDQATDMIAVPQGHVYTLTKRWNGSNYDFRPVKINSATGASAWINPPPPIYDAPNGGPDLPASIKFNSDLTPQTSPDIYIMGRSRGLFETSMKYATVRYQE